jgi:hypothetical protein
MLNIPRQQVVVRRQDRLMRELSRCEAQLQGWLSQSPRNLKLFRKDPLAAVRAAGLKIDDDLMCELEQVLKSIAGKLK